MAGSRAQAFDRSDGVHACDPAGDSTEPLDLRQTMGNFATGVAVVSTLVDGQASGMTVNSLTSVSLSPAIVLVSLTCGARTTDAILSSGRFAVSVLSARQEHIALRFARTGEDHFAGLPVSCGDHDLPVVPMALAHLDCRVLRDLTVGDHQVLFGLVTATCRRPGTPLAFFAGHFADVLDRAVAEPQWFF